MNVIILHGYGLTGSGSAIYTRDLAESLARAGHSVDVICHDETLQISLPQASISLSADGSHSTAYVRIAGAGRLAVHALTGEDIPVMYPREELSRGKEITLWSAEEMDRYVERTTASVLDLVLRRSADAILVNHTALLCEVADRVWETHAVPWSVVTHGTGLHYGVRRSPLLAARVNRSLGSASAIIALNDAVADRIADAFPTHASAIEEVSPGVDLSLFSPLSKTTDPSVGYAGRWTLDKGMHALLCAWPLVRRQHPKARLRLAGAGADGEALQAAAQSLFAGNTQHFADQLRDVADHSGRAALAASVEAFVQSRPADYDAAAKAAAGSVEWVGPLDRVGVSELFGHSHVAVLPAVVPEAFPLSILEAAASGAVPVGTDASGLGWLIRQILDHDPDLEGLLVDPDPSGLILALADALCGALDTALAQGAPPSSLREFAQPYSWVSVGAQLLDLTATVPLKVSHG